MNEIKVTAEYSNNSTSKLDALRAEYKAAKALADATVSEKQPLIDAMGEAKLELIKKQLNYIAQKMLMSMEIFDSSSYSQFAEIWVSGTKYDASVYVEKNHPACIELNNRSINYPDGYWFSEHGIVTMWNELKLYDRLLEKCEEYLEYKISEQNKRIEKINNTFSNMQNC